MAAAADDEGHVGVYALGDDGGDLGAGLGQRDDGGFDVVVGAGDAGLECGEFAGVGGVVGDARMLKEGLNLSHGCKYQA